MPTAAPIHDLRRCSMQCTTIRARGVGRAATPLSSRRPAMAAAARRAAGVVRRPRVSAVKPTAMATGGRATDTRRPDCLLVRTGVPNHTRRLFIPGLVTRTHFR